MREIKSQEFGGERPLYCEHDLYLEYVTIHAGESALKETLNIEAVRCRFEGKYPLWCCDGITVRDCHFTEGGRAALWYSRNLLMEETLVEAPKMFRQMDGIRLRRVRIPNAGETLWHCKNIDIVDLEASGADYIFMNCENIRVENLRLQGNYSFQWSKNIEIHNSVLDTKDAFWEAENVTIYDSEISGEFLAWHSRNIRFVRCHLSGSQPLCYASGLVLEDCSFGPDADLAFEYSDVEATIKGDMVSIKNPRSGSITLEGSARLIMDENIKAPASCTVTTYNTKQ